MSTSLAILASVAEMAALYLGRQLLGPVALALLFTALLRPVVNTLGRLRVPPPVTATLIVLGVLAVSGTGVFLLARPVQEWVRHAPETFAAARTKVEKLRQPVQKVTQAVEKVQQEVSGNGGAPESKAPAPSAPSPAPTFMSRIFGTTTALLGGALEVLVIVFLLLATATCSTERSQL